MTWMTRTGLWVGLLLAACGTGPVDAQNLTGVSSVVIEVPDLSEKSRRCGLSASSLAGAARITLAQYPAARVVEAEAQGILGVYVSMADIRDDYCVGTLVVNLKRRVRAHLPDGTLGSSFVAQTWEGGKILFGPEAGFGPRVNTAIEQAVKEFIAEWLKDNPKP